MTHNARVTAVSMAHGAALVRLLRAHGQAAHAASLESALHEVFRIVSSNVGLDNLAEAMRWVAEQSGDDEAPLAASRH